jgi:hypothetical protein
LRAGARERPIEDFARLTIRLVPEPDTDFNTSPSKDVHTTENALIQDAENLVLQALNRGQSVQGQSPVLSTLGKLKEISDKNLKQWPTDSRFRYKVLDLAPLVVIKFGIRDRETFRAYGIPSRVDRATNARWLRVGSDPVQPRSCVNSSDIFPLQRGPSGKPRFLAKYEHIDCGSGHGVEYAAFEWDAKQTFYYENVQMVMHRERVWPREDVDPSIWNFKTNGAVITIPYCWHSAVDSWAAAHLCSVDSYDVSGDTLRFVGTKTNYPDLETVALVAKHGQARDEVAVRGYCADDKVAMALVQIMPASHIFAVEGLKTTPTGVGKENVALSTNDFTLSFDLVKAQERWVVSRFTIEPPR